jgi:hypothetical protein
MNKSKLRLNQDLSHACFNGNENEVKDLLTCGVDIRHKDDEPLFNAVQEGNLIIVKLLIKHGANFNSLCGNKHLVEFKNKTILEFSKFCCSEEFITAQPDNWLNVYNYLKLQQRLEKLKNLEK